MKFLGTFCLVVLLVHAAPVRAEKPDPQIGKHLFLSYCALCHGKEGNSKGPLAVKLGIEPADLTSAEIQGTGREELVDRIAGYGRKIGSNMPQWGTALPRENLEHIAEYVRSLSSNASLPKGDPRRGMALFKSACAACHGQTGAGNGVLSGLIGIKMLDFTAMKSGGLNPQSLKKTVQSGRGKYMPPWKDTLSDGEMEDVVAYIMSMGK